MALDEHNRWVKLSQCIPWDELAEGYYQSLSDTQGRPSKDARLVIGAVIIKHKLCLSDRETVAQIQENPYLQYFVGLPGYQMEAPFAPSLLVETRKRMGQSVFEVFHTAIIQALETLDEKKKTKSQPNSQTSDEKQSQDLVKEEAPCPDAHSKPEAENSEPALKPDSGPDSQPETEPKPEPKPQGKLILDATVAPQAIRFPTDLSLLNEAREFTEKMIDILFPHTGRRKKPRTYRNKARKDYLYVVKRKRISGKERRRAIKRQLQYLRRNLKHIEQLLRHWPEGTELPLPRWLLYRYWVIQHLYDQQWEMYKTNSHRCDDRIVSISQPYVRPIIRGKQDKPVEFGSKLSVSLTGEGIARVNHLRWDAYHEGRDLKNQVEVYRTRYGHYPEVVLGDPVYGTRENRCYLQQHGICFAGKPLGRPKQITDENREELKQLKAQRREEYLQRIPIEGKFGQGKNGYNLNYIRAKRADTSVAWINSIFLVMNLLILLRIFFTLVKSGITEAAIALLTLIKMIPHSRRGMDSNASSMLTPTGS